MSALSSMLRLGPIVFERAGCSITVNGKTRTVTVEGPSDACDRFIVALAGLLQALPVEEKP
uniref:Uncharacterized protein n=1 Tax=mine drainage metagenome TaxID=410659 RepID=E6PBZ6_9ZZZZ